MTWLYEGREVTEEDLEGKVAFVYCITHLDSGKRYVGKKRLKKKTTRKPLKGKKRRRITYADSDWRDYWGSNEPLQEAVKTEGPEKFKREILRLCTTLSESSYYETKYQFEWDVLLHPDQFWNEWIMCKIRSAHLRNLR